MTGSPLRFAEGDVVVVVQARTAGGEKRIDQRATVKHVGPFLGGDERIQLRENLWLEFRTDYIVTYGDGALGALDDWQLEAPGPLPADDVDPLEGRADEERAAWCEGGES